MIEMSVESVRINLATQQRVVILKALDQDRFLFIWIAQAEAYAIAIHLQGTLSPRPLTHDLLKNFVEKMDYQAIRVVISDFIDDIFYSQIVLVKDDQEIELDARPSDAIALAVRLNTPIFVTEPILAQIGVTPDSNDAEVVSSVPEKEAEQESVKEAIQAQSEEQDQPEEDSKVSELSLLKVQLALAQEELHAARLRIAALEGNPPS